MTQNGDISLALVNTLGLSEQKAKETLKNVTLTQTLSTILHEVREVVIPEGTGILLYHLASKIKPQINHHLPLLVKYIITKKLDTTLRVEKGIEYALTHIKEINVKGLEEFCGVGIVVTPEEIKKVVEQCLEEYKSELIEKRYKFNAGPLMQKVRGKLPWADGKSIKNEVDSQILNLLGPKTEEDLNPASKTDKKLKNAPASKPTKEKKANEETSSEPVTTSLTIMDVMNKVNFHAPGENYKTDGYVVTDNTERLLKDHLKATGGRVQTRFPPEPNGILHIGHAKAININFGYAAAHNGVCYLRYDDTNPEKEEEKFFIGIKDMVEWLGYKPFKITHSSDYFDQLYEWAVQLIKAGLAYVCHQTADEMKGFNPEPSPWRDRPVEENLQLFQYLFLTIVFSINSASKKIDKFVDLCFKIHEKYAADSKEAEILESLTEYSNHNSRKFSCCGYFGLDKGVICSLISNVANYSIVVIQYEANQFHDMLKHLITAVLETQFTLFKMK